MNKIAHAATKYYTDAGKEQVEFLRDAVEFINKRPEEKNERRSVSGLLMDFVNHLDNYYGVREERPIVK